MVAVTGDGTNDARARLGRCRSGYEYRQRGGNMVDLDSNPTKLIEVVAIGKQLHCSPQHLLRFRCNDIAKYFAILPAMFLTTYPVMGRLNIMGLHSIQAQCVVSAMDANLIIIVLIPLALRGVKYRPMNAGALLPQPSGVWR